ncbi:hypothetical protein G6514_001687 [Epicoccum nigrum]|nr:hypothetical protein G6514_001687 [Epicoccum nigrum]
MADFDTCRNILYQKLATRACTPRIETDDTRTPINKHGVFYPAGTAEKVMSIENLEQLFTHVLASPACPNFSSTAMELARRVDLRKLQKFIAIMIVLNCDLKAMVSFTSHLVAPRTLSEDVRKNSTLPLENPTFAKSVLGNDATTNLFIEKQHEFLAPVIKKYKEVKGDFRRLPYVMEKLIGQGSFGTVYKVEISPHHFRDEDGLSNSGKLILARKDFVLTARDGAYDREREVLREIVRNVRNNSNIMESWGSLEFGTTYSLFMPLADCDLMKYMESRTQPQSFGEKAAFVKCAVDLSGAIDFLHEQLVSPNYEKLSCFHMDLKPQNILVVIRDGVHTWKLSDFNMSRVKGRKNAGLQPNRSPTFYEINKLFHQEKPIVPTSSLGDSTVNRRGTGTYLAPEACIGDSVQAESDIWSLGCVISVVFTYMCGGFSGVENFSKLRSSKSRDSTDCFFTLSRRRDLPKISDAVLNDGVARWLKQLRTTQPTDSEKAILEDLTRFLEKQVFVIDPARRKNTTADQIRLKLVAAFNGYRKIPEPRFEPTTSPRPRWKIFAKVNSSTISRPIRLDTNLDPPLVTCVLGSNACPLVCATSKKLKAFQVHHITSEAATDNLIESESVSPLNTTLSWSKHVAASIRYVIAATDNEEFEV